MGFPSQELAKWINSYFITGFLHKNQLLQVKLIGISFLEQPWGSAGGQTDFVPLCAHFRRLALISSCIRMASLRTFIYLLGYLLRPCPSKHPHRVLGLQETG